MSTSQHISEARNRTLGRWFQDIQRGRIKLPRFQRYEAWDKKRIRSFLNTVIDNLPVGITLVLEVGEKEQFISRYVSTAEPPQGSNPRVTEQLLDGQQRLTAFWRTMHNNYEWEQYFIHLPQFDGKNLEQGGGPKVHVESRWRDEEGKQRPVWTRDPVNCLQRGFFPIDLLCPGDKSAIVEDWIDGAMRDLHPGENGTGEHWQEYQGIRGKLKDAITNLRERVTHFNLPYLSLPASTRKGVALRVFIKMNTNSQPLSTYDIIVADVEDTTGEPLHDMVDGFKNEHPQVTRFGDTEDLILATSALLQERPPTDRGKRGMDKQNMMNKWGILKLGLERMAALLESQGIFDKVRLPTNAVLAVIAAAYKQVPESGDFVGKAETLLRAYLWSAFFTDRYENSAASRAYADFKQIKELLSNPGFDEKEREKIPVLNREEHALADVDSLMAAGWPKRRDIEARGILAVFNYLGARDFADGKPVSAENVPSREYHHIFPDALLAEAEVENSHSAMNCALITETTNRIVGRKDPMDYLKERAQWTDDREISGRLKTHLIPYDLLNKAHYQGLEGEELKSGVKADFDQFRRARAQLVHWAMEQLTAGERPSLDSIWADYSGGTQ